MLRPEIKLLSAVSFCFREGDWTIGVKNEGTETQQRNERGSN